MHTHGAARAGTYNSGMPFMVDTLRRVLYGKHRSTLVDASSTHYDWYERIRVYFRQYEAEQQEGRALREAAAHEARGLLSQMRSRLLMDFAGLY